MFNKENAREIRGESSLEGLARYQGLVPVQVVAINPTMKELRALYPERENIPDQAYARDKDGKPYAVVSIHLRTNPLHDATKDESVLVRLDYFLRPGARVSNDGSKTQYINVYGETRWLTGEEAASGEDVTSGNGLPLLKPYHPAVSGEAEIVRFARVFLGIGSCANYKDGAWVVKEGDELKKTVGGFTSAEIGKMLSGDASPLKEAVALAKDNYVKVLLGTRVTPGGQQYAVVHPFVLGGNSSSTKSLEREIANETARGQWANVTWPEPPYLFKKIEFKAADFSKKETPPAGGAFPDDLPF
jgi:hypothetical protein